MIFAPPPLLAARLVRPVAVFGGAVSGRGAAGLLARWGAEATLYDERNGPSGRPHYGAAEAARHDLVIVSPGFRVDHAWLRAARAAGALVLGELDLAALAWPGRVIAVTGTNGKTTLTEFLAHVLRTAGERAHAVGNVGVPFTGIHETETDPAGATAVVEVSSFQAEGFSHFRAHSAIWTNFAEDHLERHPGMGAYFAAKARLLTHTDGPVIVGETVAEWAARLDWPLGEAIAVDTLNRAPDPRLAETPFARYPQRENFLLAAALWRELGRDLGELYAAARTFVIGRHRLSRVGEVGGVTWWNDSKATNFHAALAALAGFDRPPLWIGGGRAKGGDIAGFARALVGRVRLALTIGETASELASGCAAAGVPVQVCGTLEAAVVAAAALASPGDHVLLSPGFASFDQFRHYEERGDRFESLVRALAPAGVSD
jgi:UDP-N-acetylmuramoylalanine--D-glutamate ligase